jgi:replicative DNA helicase
MPFEIDQRFKERLANTREAESFVLASIMVDNSVIDDIEFLQPRDFYVPSFRKIYEAMKELRSENSLIDIVSLLNKLRSLGMLNEGGIDSNLIYKIAGALPTGASIMLYAKIVKKYSVKRQIAETGRLVIEIGEGADDNVERDIDDAISDLRGLSEVSVGAFVSIGQCINSLLSETVPDSVSTGFPQLDRLTGGLQKGDLVIVAARPGMGKSALIMNIAQNVGQRGKVVAVFSIEMASRQLAIRYLSCLSDVPIWKIKKADGLTKTELKSFIEGSGKVQIMTADGLTVEEIGALARQLNREQPLELIIIDYLQLIRYTRHGGMDEELTHISSSLKSLARALGVPILAAAQLNRKVDERPKPIPMLSDLRGSGAIEQDADLVLFPYRAEHYFPDDMDLVGKAELIISKQRMGDSGISIPMYFDKNLTRFREA